MGRGKMLRVAEKLSTSRETIGTLVVHVSVNAVCKPELHSSQQTREARRPKLKRKSRGSKIEFFAGFVPEDEADTVHLPNILDKSAGSHSHLAPFSELLADEGVRFYDKQAGLHRKRIETVDPAEEA